MRIIMEIIFSSITDVSLVQMCQMIGHADPTIALAGINKLIDFFEKPESPMMQDYADLYIKNVCLQFHVRA